MQIMMESRPLQHAFKEPESTDGAMLQLQETDAPSPKPNGLRRHDSSDEPLFYVETAGADENGEFQVAPRGYCWKATCPID